MTRPPRPSRRRLGIVVGTLVLAGALALPARAEPGSPDGRQLYAAYCQQCHQATGLGVPGRFPPLVGSPWVTGSPDVLLRIVLDGLEGPIDVNGQRFDWVMPGARDQLSDAELAALTTYIRQWRTNRAEAIEPAAVRRARATAHAGRWTAGELSGPAAWVWWLGGAVLALAAAWIACRARGRVTG